MDAREFWDKVETRMKELDISVQELAKAIGKSRNTVYTQKIYGYMPKAEQIIEMERVLHCKLLKEEADNKVFFEFLPYLVKAEDWQLEAIRKILDMPQAEKKVSSYTIETEVS